MRVPKDLMIQLTESEVAVAKAISDSRTEYNKRIGVARPTRDRSIVEREAVEAEIAFAKAFNVYPDLVVTARSVAKGTDMGDMRLPDGRKIDVKHTAYVTGGLMVPMHSAAASAQAVDLYALVTGESPVYVFRGFARPSDLMKEENERFGFFCPAYRLNQPQLKTLEDIDGSV